MKFSVVIPAYNREKELPISIESVLNQTHSDFELIIVDNGSTDKTKEVVQSYINKDPRVKYIWQENSGSPAGSRNTGIAYSQHQWISFLDSDDFWYNQKLQKVAEAIKIAPKSIAISHYENLIMDGKILKVLKHGSTLPPAPFNDLLFKGCTLSTSAMTIRKDKLLEVNSFDTRKDYFAVEDYDLWLKLSQIGTFYYIHEVLGSFCIHETNMSKNALLMNHNLKSLLTNHIIKLNLNNKEILLKQSLAKADYYTGRSFQTSGEFIKAREYLYKSLTSNHYITKKIISLILSYLKLRY